MICITNKSLLHGLSTIIFSTRDNLPSSFEHVAQASFDHIHLHGLYVVIQDHITIIHQVQPFKFKWLQLLWDINFSNVPMTRLRLCKDWPFKNTWLLVSVLCTGYFAGLRSLTRECRLSESPSRRNFNWICLEATLSADFCCSMNFPTTADANNQSCLATRLRTDSIHSSNTLHRDVTSPTNKRALTKPPLPTNDVVDGIICLFASTCVSDSSSNRSP